MDRAVSISWVWPRNQLIGLWRAQRRFPSSLREKGNLLPRPNTYKWFLWIENIRISHWCIHRSHIWKHYQVSHPDSNHKSLVFASCGECMGSGLKDLHLMLSQNILAISSNCTSPTDEYNYTDPEMNASVNHLQNSNTLTHACQKFSLVLCVGGGGNQDIPANSSKRSWWRTFPCTALPALITDK